MATISDINVGSSYRGDNVLGGGVGIGITIDPSPMQRLATFSYYRDQHLWEQKQKDDAAAAKQIAAMTAYDITSPLTQYSDKLKTKLDELQNYVRENPDSLVYGRNPQKFLEREKKINEFETLRDAATSSSIIYSARKTEIDKNPISEDRQTLDDELNLDVEELFQSGVDVNKVLKSSAPIRQDDYKLPDVAITTVEELAVLGDLNVTTKIKKLDLHKLRADSELAAARGREPAIDENSSWFKSLSPKRQDIERRKAASTSRERKKVMNLSSSFNNLFGQYMAAHPDATLESIVGDPSGSNTLVDNIKSANAINAQIKEYNQLVLAGKILDPTKKVLRQTYDEINLKDGLSEAEIIMMNTLQKSGNAILVSLEKESQPTDNAIQRAGLAAEWGRIGIDQQKLDKYETEDKLSALAVLNQAAEALNNGKKKLFYEKGISRGNPKEVFDIADPELLQLLGKLDKDGKVTDVPDALNYDKTSNMFSLIYYDNKPPPFTLDKDKNKANKPEGRKVRNMISMTQREWLSTIIKRKNPNKDIGGVSALVEQALLQNDNSLFKISQRYANPQSEQTQTQQGTTQSQTIKTDKLKKVTVKGL